MSGRKRLGLAVVVGVLAGAVNAACNAFGVAYGPGWLEYGAGAAAGYWIGSGPPP